MAFPYRPIITGGGGGTTDTVARATATAAQTTANAAQATADAAQATASGAEAVAPHLILKVQAVDPADYAGTAEFDAAQLAAGRTGAVAGIVSSSPVIRQNGTGLRSVPAGNIGTGTEVISDSDRNGWRWSGLSWDVLTRGEHTAVVRGLSRQDGQLERLNPDPGDPLYDARAAFRNGAGVYDLDLVRLASRFFCDRTVDNPPPRAGLPGNLNEQFFVLETDGVPNGSPSLAGQSAIRQTAHLGYHEIDNAGEPHTAQRFQHNDGTWSRWEIVAGLGYTNLLNEWDSAPAFDGLATTPVVGQRYRYTRNGVTRYRLVPNSTTPFDDAFYADQALTQLIIRKTGATD